MQRRKMLAALGSVAVGGATAVSTGAFTSVEANRSVSVSVSNDANAFLGVEALDNSNASEYVSASGGTVEINIGGSDGAGVNQNAVTEFDGLFEVTNQGTQTVVFYITYDPADGQGDFPDVDTADDGDEPGSADDPAGLQDLEFRDQDGFVLNYPEDGSANGAILDVGSSREIGLRIDTRGHDLDSDEALFNGDVTLTAAGPE